ncbi:MAG: 6-pyruvoyl trahydropterin synthase family protein [Luteibaculum sp.]
MPLIEITRREHFNAAHKLWNPDWSTEKNHEVFGKCANENWHGHNYELFITVKGEPQEDTGYVCDLKALSDIIKQEVTEKLDHKNINLDVPFMKGIMASTENLVIAIWNILNPLVKEKLNCQLYCVKLYETRNNFATYYGE